MSFVRESGTTNLDASVAGALAVTDLITATAGVQLGNNIIKASDGGTTITLNASDDVAIAGNLIVDGNNIKSGDMSSSTVAITLSTADVSISGDLTIAGDDIVIGGSDDATDKTILFRHDAVPTIMGLDDTHDRFIIHTAAAFNGTVGNNDFSIDTSGNCYLLGALTVTGNDIKSSTATAITLSADDATVVGDLTVTGTSSGTLTLGGDADGVDRSIILGHTTLKTIMGIDDSADRFVINTDATFDATILANDFSIDATGNCYILGDLTVTGSRITFGNTEYIHNESNGIILINAPTKVTMESDKLYIDGQSATPTFIEIDAYSGQDAKICLSEATVSKWTLGNDEGDSDKFKIDVANFAVGGATKLTIDTSGNMTVAGGITSTGATIATRASVSNLADNGVIAITATCVNIDANGVARTGIRFAGTGTAGQIIIVNNTGGETLTFHPTPGTCLVRGLTTSLDTMESLGVYMFVSDGALWNLIGGGSLPNEGLTAS
jgi:hypothetical protein